MEFAVYDFTNKLCFTAANVVELATHLGFFGQTYLTKEVCNMTINEMYFSQYPLDQFCRDVENFFENGHVLRYCRCDTEYDNEDDWFTVRKHSPEDSRRMYELSCYKEQKYNLECEVNRYRGLVLFEKNEAYSLIETPTQLRRLFMGRKLKDVIYLLDKINDQCQDDRLSMQTYMLEKTGDAKYIDGCIFCAYNAIYRACLNNTAPVLNLSKIRNIVWVSPERLFPEWYLEQ